MPTVLKPKYTESQILAPYCIQRGGCHRVTADLRSVISGRLFVAIGLSGTTTYTNGPVCRVQPTLNNDGATRFYSASPKPELTCYTVVGRRLINNSGGYSAGASSFAFDGTGGTVWGVGDSLFFWGVDTIPGTTGALSPANGCELLRVSKGTTTPVVTTTPCKYAKIDNEIFCQGYSAVYDLEGGHTWEVVFDFGDDSAGDAIAAMADLVALDYWEQATV